ncbi:MAG: hypothetical protein AB1512_28790 [Thermodesulfobacteriota bacterium]
MKRFMSFSLFCVGILAIGGLAHGQARDEEKEVLRGLDKVHVVVERLRAEIEQDGLFTSTLQTDMELKLALAGIKVLSEEECLRFPCVVDLYLHVDAFKQARGYTYRIQLSLMEPVVVLRKHMRATGTTFRMHDELGMTEYLSEIREEARDLLDKFIEIWQAVNSKKGKAGTSP